MFDIHSHILPDILGDDGSKSIEMTLDMAKQLVDSGFTDVFATPHYIPDENKSSSDTVLKLIENTNKIISDHGIDLKIHQGHELYLDQSVGKSITSKEALTLGNSGYVLIELPMHSIPFDFESVIFDLKLRGFTPVLAHPERNHMIANDLSMVDKYLDMGILLQLNLKSISGRYGGLVKKASMELINKQYYSFVGSDGHNCSGNSMNVVKEVEILKSITDYKYFSDITYDNPRKILIDEVVSSPVIVSTTKVKSATKLVKMIGGFFGAKT